MESKRGYGWREKCFFLPRANIASLLVEQTQNFVFLRKPTKDSLALQNIDTNIIQVDVIWFNIGSVKEALEGAASERHDVHYNTIFRMFGNLF